MTVTALRTVPTIVCDIIGSHIDAPVAINTRLADLDLDELDLVEIAVSLEECFCVGISDDAIAGWVTPADIVASLSRRGIS